MLNTIMNAIYTYVNEPDDLEVCKKRMVELLQVMTALHRSMEEGDTVVSQ